MNTTRKFHPDLELAVIRRQQVLDAAESCFRSRGFHGASMAEISKAAGMSAGHIYNYFESKEAIIIAFVSQNVARLSELICGLVQRHDPLQDIFDDIEKSVRANLRCNQWKLPLEIFAEASRNPQIARLVQDADRHSRRHLRDIMIKGRAARGLVTDIAMVDGRIEAMISIFQGLHARILHNPEIDEAALVAAIRLTLTPLLFGD